MKLRTTNRVAAVSMAAALAMIAAAMGMPTAPVAVAGSPVEYVRICDEVSFGTGFFYLPGSDECYNAATRQAKSDTAGGRWTWRVPNNPHQFVKAPKKACKGELVEFGEITTATLALSDFNRLEATTRVPLSLGPDEYVSAVIYKGGFSGTANFCTYYYYEDAVDGAVYTPLGCLETLPLKTSGATAVFVPDAAKPPVTSNPISIAVANGFRAFDPTLDFVQGSLSVWLCVQKSH